MAVTCPYCQHATEVENGEAPHECICPACGSSFNPGPAGGTTVSISPSEEKLGKFILLQVLGTGAFGTVYKARDPELDRIVAVKIPRAAHVGSGEHLERFLREARSVAQLRHPGIIPVHDVGQVNGMPFLVSEFVQGVTLADWLTATRATPRQAAQLVAQIAEALQYAHDRGIVHRDIKPSNIMLENIDSETRGRRETEMSGSPRLAVPASFSPRLMDFGLAKRDAGETTMTIEGQILGTPAYMSPEQARGEAHQVDGRSDVYSLGVILYELLTGELPFRGNSRMIMHQVLHDEPKPPRRLNDRISRDLETICLKAMAKEPNRRYASARQLADELRRFLQGEPIQARRPGLWGTAWMWLQRPERVRDAGVWMIFLGCIRFLLIVPIVVFFVAKWSKIDWNLESIKFVLYMVGMCLVHVWLGVRAIKRDVLALWLGLGLSAVFLEQKIPSLVRSFSFLSGEAENLANVAEQYTANFWLATIYSIQFSALAVALLAYYSNRNVMRWAQIEGPPSRSR